MSALRASSVRFGSFSANWLTTDDEAAALRSDARYEVIVERLKNVAKTILRSASTVVLCNLSHAVEYIYVDLSQLNAASSHHFRGRVKETLHRHFGISLGRAFEE